MSVNMVGSKVTITHCSAVHRSEHDSLKLHSQHNYCVRNLYSWITLRPIIHDFSIFMNSTLCKW